MSELNPSTEDFAALLEESFTQTDLYEGAVVKGIVVAIEKDLAVIDVGLKVEGRVPLKEFGAKGRDGEMAVGDEVEVYLERVENALGEAVLSREKARREESWQRLPSGDVTAITLLPVGCNHRRQRRCLARAQGGLPGCWR